MCASSVLRSRGVCMPMARLATFFTRNSPTGVAALRGLGSLNSLRISGDLPELHPDLQINHEAGKTKALVALVGSRAHLVLFPDYCSNRSQPTIARLSSKRAAIPSRSHGPVFRNWPPPVHPCQQGSRVPSPEIWGIMMKLMGRWGQKKKMQEIINTILDCRIICS